MRLHVIAVVSALLFAGFGTAAKADQFVVNGNFAPANPSPGYGPVPGWTASSLIEGSNSAAEPFWDNGTIPSGTTVGFIQSDGVFSQTLTGLTVGNLYSLSFVDNSRLGTNCNPACNAIPTLTVLLDGSTLIAATAVDPVGGSNPFDVVTIDFTALSSSELLAFSSVTPTIPGTNVGLDGTLLLSDVSVSTVTPGGVSVSTVTPEPSSLMLLSTSVLGAAGMMRRRFLRS
jgi:hypothetical protein